MNTKYTYEIRPNRPFNFMDKTIKTNCSLQLTLSEARTILESGKARVYRIFPDINNSVKVEKDNIKDLHRKYYNSKPILNRAGTVKEEVMENKAGTVVDKNEEMITAVNVKKEERSDSEHVPAENVEDATVFMSESEVKEALEQIEQQTEEALVEHKAAPTVESEDPFDGIEKVPLRMPEPVEENKEDISDAELEEAEKEAKEMVESEVVAEEKEEAQVDTVEESEVEGETTETKEVEESTEEKKEDKSNNNRFYNTQIMTGNSGKKKHKK